MVLLLFVSEKPPLQSTRETSKSELAFLKKLFMKTKKNFLFFRNNSSADTFSGILASGLGKNFTDSRYFQVCLTRLWNPKSATKKPLPGMKYMNVIIWQHTYILYFHMFFFCKSLMLETASLIYYAHSELPLAVMVGGCIL